MELTVGNLKNILAKLDNDVVLATLGQGNDDFYTFTDVKRLLVLKDISEVENWGGRTFLVINDMGSHFTGKGWQENLEYQQIYFDENNIEPSAEKEYQP